ncbi:type VI secretion system ATPase TssH, partial [Rhizobium leguminosarum]|nr:type VI secretion system ATPase TssH [Rhizobium leguminosarum]
MNLNNYTIKAQEVIQTAVQIAEEHQQLGIEPGHLLQAILQADEQNISFLFKKLQVNRQQLTAKLQAILESYPKASGTQPYITNDTQAILNKATSYLKTFKDEFVAVEHLLLGLVTTQGKIATLLQEVGITEKPLIQAIQELRGNTR